ncbi:isopentenyl phosphate kinase [Natronomonas amylolytica]|uniref:isopentenyl phosphate kinase n=1 Tax=Natronomonas amylolytica TaxID=3108498 RepID=UPI0030081506
MTTVLKLGGSVVTDKDVPETVDERNLSRAADAIAAVDEDLVVIHGGGSFGHPYAAEHGVSTTDGTHDPVAVRAIHGAMKELNGAVVDALAAAEVPAVPVHPFSVASRDSAGELSLPTDQLATMLSEGFAPVLHGDVVVHESAGATVISGDEIVVALADALDADRVGVCSAVPGVYDAEENVIDRIDSFDDVANALGGSDATDVTGGMAAKVRELLGLDAPAYIFDIDGLDGFIAGENPGTRIG